MKRIFLTLWVRLATIRVARRCTTTIDTVAPLHARLEEAGLRLDNVLERLGEATLFHERKPRRLQAVKTR